MTTPIVKGAGHIWEGADERTEYGYSRVEFDRRGAGKSWRVLRYWDMRLTPDHHDYLGWTGGVIDVQLDLANGNYPDGLYLADIQTRIAYRVTGGRLVPQFWMG